MEQESIKINTSELAMLDMFAPWYFLFTAIAIISLIITIDKIYKSEIMREIFSKKLFAGIENKKKFRDINLPWKIFAIHRFLEVNKFN